MPADSRPRPRSDRSRFRTPTWIALLALAWLSPPLHAASTMILVNQDLAGEGLNDPTTWSPTGGNPATTLGEARSNAVLFALALWAEQLESSVEIRVGVELSSLGGTAASAPLASGATSALYRDFAGAPRAGTWYPSALADRLAGLDLGGAGSLDVIVVVNADVDGAALGESTFYYGFDQNPPAGDVDFIAVFLHELTHGLGFQTYLDTSTGEKLLGYDDSFLVHLEQHGASPADLPSMNDAGRLAALTAEPELHWTGPAAVSAAAMSTAGTGADGHLEMYAPSPLVPASSVVHFSTSFTPDSQMEPFYLGTPVNEATTGVARALLADLGWNGALACTNPFAPLFSDGFESGDFSRWDLVVGTQTGSATGGGTGERRAAERIAVERRGRGHQGGEP